MAESRAALEAKIRACWREARDIIIRLLLDWIPDRRQPAHREYHAGCGVCSTRFERIRQGAYAAAREMGILR